jgi:class III cytochrome C family protein
LSQELRKSLGNEVFQKLETSARQAIHAKEFEAQMVKLAADHHVSASPASLKRFSQLYHRDVRVAQLAEIQCTNCHSYGDLAHPIAGQEMAHHFSVKTSSCITCHFTNETFNTGTTSCLLCHALPKKEITVHEALTPEQESKLKSPELTKQPIRIDHEAMVKRNVSCYSCHADVAVQNTPVSKRDCERCHDRPEFLSDWKENLTLDQVKHYHAVHVPQQRAKCLDCHSEIQHQLIRQDTPLGQPAFLSSAIAKCTQCHPNQHAEQIQLLSGVGGEGVPKGNPNLMFGARTNCFGCHQEQVVKKHGGVSIHGSVAGCVSCHGDRHKETFEKWKLGIKMSLLDAEEAFDLATKKLAGAKNLDESSRNKANDLLKSCEADLLLVKRGNAVHNVTYSIDLLDSVTRRAQQAITLVAKGQKK